MISALYYTAAALIVAFLALVMVYGIARMVSIAWFRTKAQFTATRGEPNGTVRVPATVTRRNSS